jgi:hypothetical protein
MDVAQTPGWATWVVGFEDEGLPASRLSSASHCRKDWLYFSVAGWLVEVMASRSVMRLVCSYASWDSRAWTSCLLK